MPWEVCMSLHSRLKDQKSSGQPCWGHTHPLQYQCEIQLKPALQAAAWEHLHIHRYALMLGYIACVDCRGNHNNQLRSSCSWGSMHSGSKAQSALCRMNWRLCYGCT